MATVRAYRATLQLEGGTMDPQRQYDFGMGGEMSRKIRDFDWSFKGHIVVLHKNTKSVIFSKKVEFCKKKLKNQKKLP